MRPALRKLRNILIAVYLLVLHAGFIYLAGDRIIGLVVKFPNINENFVPPPTKSEPVPTPLPVPEQLADLHVTPSPAPSITIASAGQLPAGLMIPVLGIKPEQLTDTFEQARGTDRRHDAIDIMAPGGTPVVAADDGEIVKLFDSEQGGITIYQLNRDKTIVYYYAHLMKRADGLRVGDFVNKGSTIGFVGDTGNAGPGNYHLHFSMARISDPKRYFTGEYLNPYLYLTNPSIKP